MSDRTEHPATFRAALIQMCTSRDLDENVATATALIKQAAADGANYIQTPEVTTLMEMRSADLFEKTPWADNNAPASAFASLAQTLGIWLHIGSMGVRVSDDKIANRSFLFSPAGEIAASYDKIHMFDVTLGNGEHYRESKNYRPGTTPVVARLPWGRMGMTICYDLRFPSLYEELARAETEMLAIPSAFTIPTGKAHWEALLRARAIETQCFVFAAAQAGEHACRRSTYGHSLIISPWGEILAEGGDSAPEVVTADIAMSDIAEARRKVPALDHRRAFEGVSEQGQAPTTTAGPGADTAEDAA
ncbi:MAG: carbon-nitrogen hydrolase family protein [Pseudomonadota bacterium]